MDPTDMTFEERIAADAVKRAAQAAHEAECVAWRAAHPDDVAADEAVHARVRAEMAAAADALAAAGGQ